MIERTSNLITLVTDGASLVIESPCPAGDDPDLHDAIGRLAPHLTFAPATRRGPIVERVAMSSDERVLVGRFTREMWSIAFVLASRDAIDIDGILADHLTTSSSPFDHFCE